MDKQFEFLLYYRTCKVRNEEGELVTPMFSRQRIDLLKSFGFKRGNELSDFYKEEQIFAGGKIEALELAKANANYYSNMTGLIFNYRINMRIISYTSNTYQSKITIEDCL